MIFDMISTTTMIKLGRVEDNQMVNVLLINDKIIDRAVRILMEKSGLTSYEEARKILLSHGSVAKAMGHLNNPVL
jgi:N-acetylmuramic acid 6-phosphate etherase